MIQIKNFLVGLSHKIAFMPTLISVGGLLFAWIMLFLEKNGASAYLNEISPSLVINSTETARTVLSALISGLISLMVFSFSMVMVLLNQASSNFSPRVLPGLISNKQHQVILGFFLGTILYNIFVLIAIEPVDENYQTPGFPVLSGIILTVFCLGSFIYFIHSISESIQVSNILKRIHKEARSLLTDLLENDEDYDSIPDIKEWHSYNLAKTGYFQGVIASELAKICSEEETKIYIPHFKGKFIHKDDVGLYVNRKLSEENVEKILKNFIYAEEEFVGRNFLYGFKQITEIAVKAMSPGINDPGTAITAIDYLNDLFIQFFKRRGGTKVQLKDNEPIVYSYLVPASEVLHYVMVPLRQYCKHDRLLLEKLLIMLQSILLNPISSKDKKLVENEIDALTEDAFENLTNSEDQKRFKQLADA